MNKIGLFLVISCGLWACQTKDEVKFDQYVAEGYSLYGINCANCHQENGLGLAGLYPPIAKEYLKDKAALACMMRNGMAGKMVVEGKVYNRVMPGNLTLKDLEIAEIATYLGSRWNNERTITTTDSVKSALLRCAN